MGFPECAANPPSNELILFCSHRFMRQSYLVANVSSAPENIKPHNYYYYQVAKLFSTMHERFSTEIKTVTRYFWHTFSSWDQDSYSYILQWEYIHPTMDRDSLQIQTNNDIPVTPGNLTQALQHWQTAAARLLLQNQGSFTLGQCAQQALFCTQSQAVCIWWVHVSPGTPPPHLFSVQLQKKKLDFVRTGKGDKRIWGGRRRRGGGVAGR